MIRKTLLLQWGVCLRHHVRRRVLADVKAGVKGGAQSREASVQAYISGCCGHSLIQ